MNRRNTVISFRKSLIPAMRSDARRRASLLSEVPGIDMQNRDYLTKMGQQGPANQNKLRASEASLSSMVLRPGKESFGLDLMRQSRVQKPP